MTWHDTAAGGLAARRLALQRQDGRWQLTRLDAGPFAPPGQRPATLADADTATALGFAAEDIPPPVATLQGRLRTAHRTGEDGPHELRLLDGTLRTPAGSGPCCRLLLTGEPAQVAAFALALAGSVDLAVPPASLAAAAVAPSGAAPDHPLAAGASVEQAFVQVASGLTAALLSWAPRIAPGADDEAVHQMRVALRRLRSALSVFGPAIDCADLAPIKAGCRRLGQALGPARDWDVFLAETRPAIAAALPDEAALADLMRHAAERREAHHVHLRQYLAGADFRRLCLALVCLLLARPWRDSPDAAQTAAQDLTLPAYAVAVLRRRTRKLRAAGATIDALPTGRLHDIRLLAKRARYAGEFFAPLFPGAPMKRWLRRLARLQACLGVLNDGAVAAGLMAELTGPGSRPEALLASGMVRGFAAARAGDVRHEIAVAWKKFRKHQPFGKTVDN